MEQPVFTNPSHFVDISRIMQLLTEYFAAEEEQPLPPLD